MAFTRIHVFAPNTQGDISLKKSYPQVAIVALSLGIAFFVACFGIALRDSVPAVPRPTGALLTLTNTTRDLGKISTQEELHVSFPIRNSGTRRLVLNALDSDCGCSLPSQHTILVAIGETIDIDVPLDTRFATGSVQNNISFTSNDPAHPHFQLTVRAFISEYKSLLVGPADHNRSSVLIPE